MMPRPARIQREIAALQQMAELHRLGMPGNTRHGGVLVTFPEGDGVELAWDRAAPFPDTLQAAKCLAAELIEAFRKQGLDERIRFTNWASVTAALQRHIEDWNKARREALYAESRPQSRPEVH